MLIRERRVPPAGLGPMLRTARERAGLTQSAVANAAGVRPYFVSKLEGGTRCPSATVAVLLADALALDDDERALLLGAAVDDAGRSHPARRAA